MANVSENRNDRSSTIVEQPKIKESKKDDTSKTLRVPTLQETETVPEPITSILE